MGSAIPSVPPLLAVATSSGSSARARMVSPSTPTSGSSRAFWTWMGVGLISSVPPKTPRFQADRQRWASMPSIVRRRLPSWRRRMRGCSTGSTLSDLVLQRRADCGRECPGNGWRKCIPYLSISSRLPALKMPGRGESLQDRGMLNRESQQSRVIGCRGFVGQEVAVHA